MRFFKRPTIETNEAPTENEPAEPEKTAPETPPDPNAGAKADLALAMAMYGARHGVADEDAEVVSEEAPMIRLANTILQKAIKEGASQILIEPDKRGLRVRYRVDGLLHESMTMPSYLKPLTARYRTLAEMNLASLCSPQSGSIAISYQSVPYDVRVDSLPTLYGESLSMRILDKRPILDGLNKLGMTTEVQEQVERIVYRQRGVFLVTGPVACGKSTTLYGLMNWQNTVERHIAAIESETEYHLGGITAVRVNGKNGLTYAAAFRSLVRAEAEIILAERMPDAEAWNAALTASEEGADVLASMPLRDAPTALWHLRNMGLDPQRLGQNITGILTQRLVRKVCANCKEFHEADAAELAPLGLRLKDRPEKVQLARGVGCEECRKTGYKGQTGIFSLLRSNQEIRGKIVSGDFSPDLYEAALANGMRPLREDGLIKVRAGQTTPEEVFRVTGYL